MEGIETNEYRLRANKAVKDDGGAAFPATEANYHNENMRGEGMSLRDYFAAKIVAAAISGGMANGAMLNRESINLAVSAGFIAADAMLAERAK